VPPAHGKAGTCSNTNVKEDTAAPHPAGTTQAVDGPHCVVQVALQTRAQRSEASACLEERRQVRVRPLSKDKLAYQAQYNQNFSLGHHSEQGNRNRKKLWRLVLHTAAKESSIWHKYVGPTKFTLVTQTSHMTSLSLNPTMTFAQPGGPCEDV